MREDYPDMEATDYVAPAGTPSNSDDDMYPDMEATDYVAPEGAPSNSDDDMYPDMEATDYVAPEGAPSNSDDDMYPDMEATDYVAPESSPSNSDDDMYPDMEATDYVAPEGAPSNSDDDMTPDMEIPSVPTSSQDVPTDTPTERTPDISGDTPELPPQESTPEKTPDGPDDTPTLPPHEEPPALPPHQEPPALPPHEEPPELPPDRTPPVADPTPAVKNTRNYYDILASLYVPEGDFEVTPESWRVSGSRDRTRHMAGRLQAKDIKFNKKYFKGMFSGYGDWKSNWKYNLAHLTTGHFAALQPVVTLAQKLGGRLFLTGDQRRRAEIFRDRIMSLTDEEIEELIEHAPEWMTESTQPKVVMDFLNQRYEKYKMDRILEHQRIVDANVLELIRRKKILDKIDPNTEDTVLRVERAQLLDGCGELVRSTQEHLLAGLKLDSQGFGRDVEAYNSRMSRVGRRDSRVGITFNEKYAELLRVLRNPEATNLQLLNAFFDHAEGMRNDTQRNFGRGVIRDVGTALNGDNLFNIAARRFDRRNDFLVQAAIRAASLGLAAANIAAAVQARNANRFNAASVNSQNSAVNWNNSRFGTDAQSTVQSANQDIDAAKQQLTAAQRDIAQQNETIGNLAGQQAISSQQVKGLEEIHSAHRGFGGLTDAQAHQQMYDEGVTLQEQIQHTQGLYNSGQIDSLQFARRMLTIQQSQQSATLSRLQELAPDLARYVQGSPGFNYQAEIDLPTIYEAFGTQNISISDIAGNYILPGNTQLAVYINGLEDSVRATVVCSLAQYALLSQSTRDLENGLMVTEKSAADRAMEQYFAGDSREESKEKDEPKHLASDKKKTGPKHLDNSRKISLWNRLKDKLTSGKSQTVIPEEEISEEEEVTEGRGR